MDAVIGAGECGIALGSNIGDRLRNLRGAVEALRPHLVPGAPVRQSPVFATEPVDCPGGTARFCNAVIIVTFGGTAETLLAVTREIERDAGRPPAEHRAVNAPRVIDLDLLYAGSREIHADDLVLPHPRLHLRRFVLEPLCWLRPGLVLPGQQRSVKALLDTLHSAEPPLEWVTADW